MRGGEGERERESLHSKKECRLKESGLHRLLFSSKNTILSSREERLLTANLDLPALRRRWEKEV